MDSKQEKQYIFNMKLARIMGLYQILTPNSTKIFNYNIYHVVIVFFGSFMFIISMLFPIGLLYLRNDIIAFMYYMGCINNFLLSSYKMGNILYYSKDIWKCIDVTSFYFVSYKHYDRNLFENCQKRSIRITYIYIVIALFAFFCWIFSPCVMNKSIITIRNIDGSYSNYRMNIFNIYLLASHETYNMNFYIFYIIEIIVSVCYVYFTIVFDVLMLLICFAISYQLETISNSIKLLGYEIATQDNIRTSKSIQLEKKCDKIYNDLITIMADHQNVIKKLNDFYNMFRLVTLTQIFIASSSHVFIWFIAAMSLDGGDNADSILSFKLFIVLPLINFQLFMTCSLFGTINEKKDSIIFALYSSNWTDMDLKSKKIVLLSLTINNANQLKMKFTSTKIVNLEMFSHTMRFCYSIFSMLINYNNKNFKKGLFPLVLKYYSGKLNGGNTFGRIYPKQSILGRGIQILPKIEYLITNVLKELGETNGSSETSKNKVSILAALDAFHVLCKHPFGYHKVSESKWRSLLQSTIAKLIDISKTGLRASGLL
ncbi:odorant receptor 4-like [Melanaphis sacchari]|uniref:odorant receptor 4-like n=1 Tax=Melanaphis sacchari TaxID=742174 RepID=UPI000DC13DC1|nr:odorant receptor 4-like [Melanaphis sacchari]